MVGAGARRVRRGATDLVLARAVVAGGQVPPQAPMMAVMVVAATMIETEVGRGVGAAAARASRGPMVLTKSRVGQVRLFSDILFLVA